MQIGGIQVPPVIGSLVELTKAPAEQAINESIREAVNDPAKSLRELQAPSPLGQFIDIRI